MSTTEELGEVPPDPVAIVFNLHESVEGLVTVSERLRQEPTEDTMGDLYAHAFNVKTAAQPIFAQKFFYETEEEILIGTTVEAILNTGNDLTKKAGEIPGKNFEDLDIFSEDIHDTLTNSLIKKDISAIMTLKDGSGEEIEAEEAFDVASTEVVHILDEHFSHLVDQYVECVISDPTVQDYIEHRQDEMQAIAYKVYEKAERIKQAKQLGAVMAAAFAGTFLANHINKR